MHTYIAAASAATFYLLASFLIGRVLLRRQPSPAGAWALVCGTAAVAAHALSLYWSLRTPGGLNLNPLPLLSFFLWGASGLALLYSRLQRPAELLLPILFPLSALAVPAALLLPGGASPQPWEPAMAAHVLLSALASGLLAIAALQVAALFLLDTRLKQHRLTGLMRILPSMQSQEEIIFQTLGAGAVLLLLAMLSGALFTADFLAGHMAYKILFSFVALGVMLTLLIGRRLFGWRGRTVGRWTLAGFVLLLVAYFGNRLLA